MIHRAYKSENKNRTLHFRILLKVYEEHEPIEQDKQSVKPS